MLLLIKEGPHRHPHPPPAPVPGSASPRPTCLQSRCPYASSRQPSSKQLAPSLCRPRTASTPLPLRQVPPCLGPSPCCCHRCLPPPLLPAGPSSVPPEPPRIATSRRGRRRQPW